MVLCCHVGDYCQWWKVSRYIYSTAVLKYNFEVLVLYLSISIVCYFIFLHYSPLLRGKYCAFRSTTLI